MDEAIRRRSASSSSLASLTATFSAVRLRGLGGGINGSLSSGSLLSLARVRRRHVEVGGSWPRLLLLRKRRAAAGSAAGSVLGSQALMLCRIDDIRQQLNEQLRCLDQKLDTQSSIVLELQDFFRKRAEVEAEYSRGLDRLTKQFMMRHKTDKQKRESWPTCSTYACWHYMMNSTRRESRDHGVLAELYSTVVFQRLGDVVEDLRRTFDNCRDIGFVCHEEMLKVLNELQTAMKQYHVYHSECKQAELKFKHAEEQRMKVEQQTAKGSKKLKVLEKQVEKRQAIYEENKLKAQSARNDYLLAIDAANASLQKYFVDDLQLLIDSIDFGYHNSVQRAMLMCLSVVENLKASQQAAADGLNKCVQDLDQSKDKHKFIDSNGPVFQLPKRFDFQPHKGDEVCQVTVRKQELQDAPVDDLWQRYQQLDNRLETMRLQNEELWKSVEEVDKNLMHMINQKDYDVTECFQNDVFAPRLTPADVRKKRLDTEAYYFEKFREVLLDNNLLARLLAKYGSLKKAFTEVGYITGSAAEDGGQRGSILGSVSRHHQLPRPVKARRVAKTPLIGQPKVFGCNLEEYIEATDEQIPLVMRSCIRAINLHGMHHEGIFRVSGLQVEINEFKAAFEKGEDPLASISDGSSINSVAGVLKSFFRELKEPMFPLHLFDSLVEASRHESVDEAAEHIRDVLHAALSRPRIVVMRYLFAFLNHLSQYSDENLMYPYNLSICFGPTLLPIPPDKDQVAYQAHVNELIKTIIVHQEKVFPIADAEPVYEKVLIDGGDRDDGDGSEDEQSEEDADVFEAVAAYDFEGRSDRELSFKKGTSILLYKRVSSDWWEGACQGKEGLIADKYIIVKRSDDGAAAGTRLMSTSLSSSEPAAPSAAAAATAAAGTAITPEKRRSVDLSAVLRRQQQHALAAASRDSKLFAAAAAAVAGGDGSAEADPSTPPPPPLPPRLSSSASLSLALGKAAAAAGSTPVGTPTGPRPLTSSTLAGDDCGVAPVLVQPASSFHFQQSSHALPSPAAGPLPQPFSGPILCSQTAVDRDSVFDDVPASIATPSADRAVSTKPPPATGIDDDLDSVLASVMSDLQALSSGEPLSPPRPKSPPPPPKSPYPPRSPPQPAKVSQPSRPYSTTFSAEPEHDLSDRSHPAPASTPSKSLERSGEVISLSASSPAVSSRRQTPDLVQDLPVGSSGANSDAEDVGPTAAARGAGATVTATTSVADTFANAKANTVLRAKSSSMPRSQQPSSAWDAPPTSEDDKGNQSLSSSALSGSFMTDEPGRQLTSFRRATSMSGGNCTGSRVPRPGSVAVDAVPAAATGSTAAAGAIGFPAIAGKVAPPPPPTRAAPPMTTTHVCSATAIATPSEAHASPASTPVAQPMHFAESESSPVMAPVATERRAASASVGPAAAADDSRPQQQTNPAPATSIAAPETSSNGSVRASKLWLFTEADQDRHHQQSPQQRQSIARAPASYQVVAEPVPAVLPDPSSSAELSTRKVPPPVPAKSSRPPPPVVLPKPHISKQAIIGSNSSGTAGGGAFTDL